MSWITHDSASLRQKARGKVPRLVILECWTLRRAAERLQCSPAPAKNGPTVAVCAARPAWWTRPLRPRRSRTGPAPLRASDRYTVVHPQPGTPRYRRRAPALGSSTVSKVLVRYRLPWIPCLDQASGLSAQARTKTLRTPVAR